MKLKVNDILVKREDSNVYPSAVEIVSIKDNLCNVKYLYNDFKYFDAADPGMIMENDASIKINFRYPTDRELKLIQLKMIR